MTEFITTEQAQRRLQKILLAFIIVGLLIAVPSAMTLEAGGDNELAIWALVIGGGYAFVAVLMLLISVVQARKKNFPPMSDANNVLANWTYPEAEWKKFSFGELRNQLKDARYAAVSVIVVLVLICLAAWFFERENISVWEMLLGGIIIGLLAAPFGWLIMTVKAYSTYIRSTRGENRVIITKNFIRVGESEYNWKKTFHYNMRGVIIEEMSEPKNLVFALSAPRQREEVRVPIPPGKEDEARKVIAELTKGK